MARKSPSRNGHNRLDEAMAMLIQNHATFVSQLSETERATSERFASIENDMAAILRVLAEHGRLLERLSEAVRDKIGFKAQS